MSNLIQAVLKRLNSFNSSRQEITTCSAQGENKTGIPAKVFRSGLGVVMVRALLPAAFGLLISILIFPADSLKIINAGLLVWSFFVVIELCFWAAGKQPVLVPLSVKQLLKRVLLLTCLLSIALVIKVMWMNQYVITGKTLLTQGSANDLLERRTFLLNRVARADFGPQEIPGFIESPFREELAIASLSMAATALTNIAFLYPETRAQSVESIGRIIEAMLTRKIRRYEVIWWGHDALDTLDSGRGQIGYLGHLNLALGAYRILGGDSRHDDLHRRVSGALATRLLNSPGYHAETFPGLRFTADNTIVYATLAHYDIIHGSTYASLLEKWVSYTKSKLLDPESGMVLYYVDEKGKAFGTPRGVLQAWNSMWLPHIDEVFAKEQYTTMKEHLADNLELFNLGGIREYPVGIHGHSDMIAGPTIAGVSSAATGFAIAGARFQRDTVFLTSLLRTAEFVGSTVDFGSERYFLLSPLVGEAIVLAALSSTRWDGRYVIQ